MTDPNDVLDPAVDPHYYERERTKVLRERYGDDFCWDKDFAPVDVGASEARKASQELKNIIAANTVNPEQPLRFSVRVANRQVSLEVRPPRDLSDKWECTMPCEIEAAVWEWRILRASSYEELIGLVNKQLAAAPLVRDLTSEEFLELSRMCSQKKNLAEVLSRYVNLRTGKTFDESVLRDPRLTHVLDAACTFIFFNSEPKSTDSPEFRTFLKTYRGTRPLSLPLIKSAFEAFKTSEKDAEKLRLKGLTPEGEPLPEHVGQADLEAANDKEIAQSLTGVRRAFGEAERRRRDLIHAQPRTAEQAIRDVRGPSDYGEEL